MRSTLEDVARLAGVSKSTASRALNGDANVLPGTRQQVLSAARSLRYRPNRTASALRTRRTGLLGLAVNSLYNATFNTLADVLQAGALTHGYQLLIGTTQGDPDTEARFLDTVLEHHVDGVVIAGTGQNLDRITGLQDAGTAVVLMNREVPGATAPSVMPAYRTAAVRATEHLLALNHRRIGFLGGLKQVTSGREHFDGFLASMAGAGLAVDPALVCRGPFEPGFGAKAAAELLDAAEPPTALLVANHEATFGLVPVLSERGIGIPDQLSVICTEDAPWFAWWHPRLTVIDTRAGHMAELALDLLMRQLGGEPEAVARGAVVEPVVVERESTAHHDSTR